MITTLKEIEFLIERWKAGNVGFKPTGDQRTGLVFKDNKIFLFDPQKEFIKPGTNEKYFVPWLTEINKTSLNIPDGAVPNPVRALFGSK